MDALQKTFTVQSNRLDSRSQSVLRLCRHHSCSQPQEHTRHYNRRPFLLPAFHSLCVVQATSASRVVCASQAEASDKMKVGFVGIGIMGLAMVRMHMHAWNLIFVWLTCHQVVNGMGNHLLCCLKAENLIKDGYDLTVWNRNKDKCKALQEKGAKVTNASIANLAPSRGFRLCALQLQTHVATRCILPSCACDMSHVVVQVAESAKAVAEQCDITVAMLADPQAAEAVATGPDGIAAGMKAGQPALLATLAFQSHICFAHPSLLSSHTTRIWQY